MKQSCCDTVTQEHHFKKTSLATCFVSSTVAKMVYHADTYTVLLSLVLLLLGSSW